MFNNKIYREPFLYFDVKKMTNNIIKISKKIIELKNVKLLFPIKSFPVDRILTIFAENNFGFDVANLTELNSLNSLCLDKELILSFTGPLINNINFNNISGCTKLMINADNKHQYCELKNEYPFLADRLGIRFNLKNYISEMVDYSYLGMTDLDFCIKNKIIGIHTHNSHKKDEEYIKLVTQFLNQIRNERLEYINIGGCCTDMSMLEFQEYITTFRDAIPPKLTIYVEAGDFWNINCGYLICRVLYIKKIDNIEVIMLDISRGCHLRWSSPKYLKKLVNIVPKKTEMRKILFVGCSCNQEVISEFYTNEIFVENEILIFNKITGYSVAWNKNFNGISEIKVIYGDGKIC